MDKLNFDAGDNDCETSLLINLLQIKINEIIDWVNFQESKFKKVQQRIKNYEKKK